MEIVIHALARGELGLIAEAGKTLTAKLVHSE
jgi:hypothetical protein